MSLISTQRLLNSLENGTMSSAQLQTYLSTTSGLSDFRGILTTRSYYERCFSNSTISNIIAGSALALSTTLLYSDVVNFIYNSLSFNTNSSFINYLRSQNLENREKLRSINSYDTTINTLVSTSSTSIGTATMSTNTASGGITIGQNLSLSPTVFNNKVFVGFGPASPGSTALANSSTPYTFSLVDKSTLTVDEFSVVNPITQPTFPTCISAATFRNKLYVAIAPTAHTFAITSQSTARVISSTLDDITISASGLTGLTTGQSWVSVAANNTAVLFLRRDNSGSFSISIARSTNGIDFGADSLPASCATVVSNGTTFLAIRGNSSNTYYTSTTGGGGSWTGRTLPVNPVGDGSNSTTSNYSMRCVNGTFIYFSNSSLTTYYTSTDGITWSAATTSPVAGQYNIDYLPYKNLYVVGSSGRTIFTSPDLITWTESTGLPYRNGGNLAVGENIISSASTTAGIASLSAQI